MREEKLSQVRERGQVVGDHLYVFKFYSAIGAHSISEEVVGFSPLWFPRGKILCLLSLVFIGVHVILSDKILRSHCLNDKNLTWYQS